MVERLTYRKHIKAVSSRASQRLGLMRRTQRILNPEGLCSVYKRFVRPVMDYSTSTWMGEARTHLLSLDRVQRGGQRMIEEEVVLDSLDHRRKVGALTYLYKLQCEGTSQRLQRMVPPTIRYDMDTARTRGVLHRACGHGFQLRIEMAARSLNGLKRSLPHCIIDDWNRLPVALFKDGISIQGMRKFKLGVSKTLREETQQEPTFDGYRRVSIGCPVGSVR